MRYAQAGRSEAFEELVRRHQVPMYRTALRLTGNVHTAQDVTQEAFLAAWRSVRLFRADSSFASWLYRIVVNTARNTQRSRRDVPAEAVPVSGTAPGADHEAEERAALRRIAAALTALPFEQRAALVLRMFEGKSYEEIADILKISTTAVRGRLHRARQQLATTLRTRSAPSGSTQPERTGRSRPGSRSPRHER